MAVDFLAEMEEASKRATASGSGNGVPVFLFFKGNMKASVRPLWNRGKEGYALVVAVHSRFNPATNKPDVNAVCAGPTCQHCATVASAAKDDKDAWKLTAQKNFFMPVYVNGIQQKNESGQWVDLMYKDSEGIEKPVSGFRLLELSPFGTIAAVFEAFKNFWVDNEQDAPHDLTARNFTIERKEEGTKQLNGRTVPAKITYDTLPKPVKPMSETQRGAVPTPEHVLELITTARPPALIGGAPAAVAASSNGASATHEDAPEF